MVRNGEILYNISGCEIKIDVLPTWDRGSRKSYESPGYKEATQAESPLSTSSSSSSRLNSLRPPTPFITPTKRRVEKGKTFESDICQIYQIVYESDANVETDSFWINCSKGVAKKVAKRIAQSTVTIGSTLGASVFITPTPMLRR